MMMHVLDESTATHAVKLNGWSLQRSGGSRILSAWLSLFLLGATCEP
jgi:hypothetical protein